MNMYYSVTLRDSFHYKMSLDKHHRKDPDFARLLLRSYWRFIEKSKLFSAFLVMSEDMLEIM